MSDTMGAADQFATALQGQDLSGTEGQQVSPEPTTQQQDNQQVSYSPYAQQFLQDVPEDQRAIVEQHLRKWDAGFTRYAQGVNDQLKQYQSLGDAQQLQQAVQYYNQLLNDPHSVAELLIQNGFGPQQAAQMAQQVTQQQNPQQQIQQDPFQQMPDPIRQRFETVDQLKQQYQQMERAMGLIAQKFNEQDQMAQEQVADQQLDQLLGQMKQQFGDFDETYILTQLANGANPDQAIRNYQSFIQREVNKRAAPQAPQVISGSSLPAIKTPLDTADQRNAALTAALRGLGLGNG